VVLVVVGYGRLQEVKGCVSGSVMFLVGTMAEVPGFDGHLENDKGLTGL
jgi:hypothetical protein